jgi:hypothetical protein
VTFSPADDFVVSLKIEKKNVVWVLNEIIGNTSNWFTTVLKKRGGVEKPY